MTKTAELTGAALDWAVAKCEGVINGDDLDIGFIRERGYTPSTDWAQGGPIIEREKITILYVDPDDEEPLVSEDCWTAGVPFAETGYTAQTPLIAAMRCYVASKLGEDVEIPEELK